MDTKRLTISGSFFCLSFLLLFLLCACTDPLVPSHHGTLRINIGDNESQARTVYPEKNFDAYTYVFTKHGENGSGTPQNEIPDSNGLFTLETGIWAVVVTAYIGKTIVATSPETTFELGDSHKDLFIALVPTNTDSEGTFKYEITYPKSADVKSFQLENLEDLTKPAITINAAVPHSGGASETIMIKGDKTIGAGYYLLNIVLTMDGMITGKTEVVHIYGSLASTYTAAFDEHDFIPVPLAINISPVIDYDNGGTALTPIEAVVDNMTYTEHTATFTVKVSGFLSNEDANGIGLAVLFNNGLTCSGSKATSGNVADNIKTFTITVTYNGTEPFSTGKSTITVTGLTGIPGNYFYDGGDKAIDVAIADGLEDYDGTDSDRRIPVRGNNVQAFNAYAHTSNGLTRHYQQIENIYLSSPQTGQSNWTAIGGEKTPFIGTYNGNGYIISNLVINAPSIKYQGLFGYIGSSKSSSVVKNVGLVGTNITGDAYVGGLAGYSRGGIVENCYTTGNVNGHPGGSSFVGGVVGYNNNSVIKNCYTTSTVKGYSTYTGGITGINYGTIENCYATSSVTGEGDFVGGIAGGNNEGGTIKSSYASGTITSHDYAGGIVGYNRSNATVQNCIALNKSITTSNSHVGRVTGLNAGTCTNNYAWKEITMDKKKNPADDVNDIDGGGLTAIAVKTQASWVTAGFAFGSAKWKWSDGKKPYLFGNDQKNWPEYIAD